MSEMNLWGSAVFPNFLCLRSAIYYSATSTLKCRGCSTDVLVIIIMCLFLVYLFYINMTLKFCFATVTSLRSHLVSFSRIFLIAKKLCFKHMTNVLDFVNFSRLGLSQN